MPLIFSTTMKDILRNAAIVGAIGFMYHTNSIFEDYNDAFTRLLKEYFPMLYVFYDHSVEVVTKCEQGHIRLEHIKSKLRASQNNRRFHQSDMLEIVVICSELKNNFDGLFEVNKDMILRATLFYNKISGILTRFQASRFVYAVKYNVFGVVEGGIILDFVFSNPILSVLCGLIGVQLAMYCTSYEKKSVEMILNKLKVRLENLTIKMSDYRDKVNSVIVYCARYQESANLNVQRSLASGARVNFQTDKMIDETLGIQTKLQELRDESKRNAADVNRIIISESIDIFLALSGIHRQKNE